MKYSFTVSTLLSLASYSAVTSAIALPVRDASPGSFTLDVYRREAPKYHVRRGGATPAAVSVPNGGADWYANATAGGQAVDVLLDTGSSDLWIVAPSDTSDVLAGGVQTYDPSKTGKQMQGATFSIGYGMGGNGVSGPVYTDKFCIGEACVNDMAIGSATKDQGLGNFPRSGIIGLAFGAANSVKPNNQKTFMEALQPQLAQPIMTFELGSPNGNSKLTFGSVDEKSYEAPLQKIKAQNGNNDKYANSWSFENVKYESQGQTLGTFDIVFDTGAPHTTGNEAIVRAYYKGVPGAKDVNGDATSWQVPCGTKLPDLTLHLGDAIMIIPGEKLYNGQTQTTGNCDVWFIKENSATRAAVGDPFFAQHVVIFNQADSTISWGNQV